MYLICSLAAALCFALGGVGMKLSEGLTRPGPGALVYLSFAGGATLQALAMRQAPLGASYLLVLGLESGLAFGLGVVWFHEAAPLPKLLGLALIAAGIALLHWEPQGAIPSPPPVHPPETVQASPPRSHAPEIR